MQLLQRLLEKVGPVVENVLLKGEWKNIRVAKVRDVLNCGF